MDENTRKKVYAALAAPFPEEAIERTKGSVTGKGYDTAGVRAQFLINRINETLGLGCYRIHRSITSKPLTTAKGRTMFEAICDMTVELGEWVNGNFVSFAEAVADGGSIAVTEFDAKKGAHTNAFKRCVAGFGLGRAAWEGKLDEAPDDDNIPSDDVALPRTSKPAPAQPHNPQPPNGYVRSGQPVDTRPAQNDRSRISSKQLAAIWAITRKLGLEQSSLRAKLKTQFGKQAEYLSREEASQTIGALQAQLNANGSGNHADPPAESLAS